MDAGSKCEAIVKAEQAYFSLRMALHASGEEASQLRLAFGSRRGAEMALRYVRDARIELVVDLLPELVEMAMTTNSQVLLTREVLARVDPEAIRALTGPTAKRLIDEPDTTDFEFRKIIEFLLFVGDAATVRSMVDAAARSDDPYLKELAEEYSDRL